MEKKQKSSAFREKKCQDKVSDLNLIKQRKEVLERYQATPDNLLFILHDLQDNNPRNYLTEDDLRASAAYLGLTYSFVYGVTSFYTMFSLRPRGRYVIRFCQSPPCQLLGASTIARELKQSLNIDFNETTPDGMFSLEMSSCLGVCGVAPAMMINQDVYGNLTKERISEIIAEKRRES